MKKNYKYIVVFLMCFAAFTASFCQYQTSSLGQQLITHYNLTNSQFSSICNVGMIPSIFCSIIAGLIIDRLGPKLIISIVMFLACVGFTLRLFATNYFQLYILMLLPGFAATFINATNSKIFGSWFDVAKVAGLLGLFQASNAIGQTVAISTANLFSSYHSAFIFSDILYIVLFVLWILLMKDKKETSEKKKFEFDFSVVKKIIVFACALTCLFGAFNTVTTFMVVSLQSKGLDANKASFITSVISVARFMGCILLPRIIDNVYKKKYILFTLLVTVVASMIFIQHINNYVITLALLFVIGFIIGGTMPIILSIPIGIEGIGKEKAGMAGGVLLMFQMLGAVVVPTYICSKIAGTNYQLLFTIAGVICAIGALLLIFKLNKTRSISKS